MLIDFNNIVRKYGKPNGILHVGANSGQEFEKYNELGINRVVWVEALPHIYEKLLKHINGHPNHIAIKACITDIDNEDVTMNESNNEAQSSSILEFGTHKNLHPEVHYVAQHKMKSIRLDTLLDNSEIIDLGHGLDMINIDIQGIELRALKSLGNRIMQFNKIYVEINGEDVYKNCDKLPEMDKYLASFGYKRVIQHWFKFNTWGDGLWIK
jgi:FkbM family methyltransferase